ncbi:hypothetical protein ACIOEZ_34220 [Streptomyces sp. NPDC087866]|uniref:hypothetical protein n=1 Tax=Streptomyces sp. NPDC087866 TaxID=3365815 RepID=UPI003806E893
MSGRKQARAMDLPDFPSPPSVSEIVTHAGSWGWVNSGHVAQDSSGYLWVEGKASPSPAARHPQELQALVAWSEEGLVLYLPRTAYQHIRSLHGDIDEAAWVPIVGVMKECPGYAF